ncbi:MAG: hypothetical protein ACM3O8_14405 [Methylococcaceae bacterium]|nr:hypothetical protein [Prolixibacteraceae bacterium]
MTNRNIKDIDQLFREGLNPEKDPYALPEGEWSKMEQRLDRYDRRKGAILWLTRIGAVAALVFLFFMLRTLIPDDSRPIQQQANVERKDSSQADIRAREQTQKDQSTQRESQDLAVLKQEKTADKRLASTRSQLALKKHGKDKTLTSSPAADTTQGKTTKGDSLQLYNRQNTVSEPVVIAREENTAVTEPVVPEKEKATRVEGPIFAIDEAGQQPEAERSARKMALSVMAAPAYNGVSNLNNGSMGNDVGLLVSYEIAKNWNVTTGGIYAKKLYETGFQDYKPKNNIWSEYYPQRVNADCRVLDIPLNLSYTFIKGKDRTLSMGTGLSSYIMLREDYRFTYAETDSNTPLNYRVVNQNRHWLSVVNLQATIEQRLSKRVSISLQPYMKIPLTDIGFAGVKLQSLGMAANLNWNFNL